MIFRIIFFIVLSCIIFFFWNYKILQDESKYCLKGVGALVDDEEFVKIVKKRLEFFIFHPKLFDYEVIGREIIVNDIYTSLNSHLGNDRVDNYWEEFQMLKKNARLIFLLSDENNECLGGDFNKLDSFKDCSFSKIVFESLHKKVEFFNLNSERKAFVKYVCRTRVKYFEKENPIQL